MKALLENLKRTMAKAVGIKDPPPLAARRILFVCMGNICRSPTAEGVFRKLLAEQAPELDVQIDSAGTHGYHAGAPPDPRACRAAERRGVDLKPLRARQVTAAGLRAFRARAGDGRAESAVPARSVSRRVSKPSPAIARIRAASRAARSARSVLRRQHRLRARARSRRGSRRGFARPPAPHATAAA